MTQQQINFALDRVTGDLEVGRDGQLVCTLTTAETLAQRIRTRMQTFLGEYYLDERVGVPYFEEVQRKNPDISSVRALLLAELLRVPGVKSVSQFDTEFDSKARTFKIYFQATSDEGIPLEGEL